MITEDDVAADCACEGVMVFVDTALSVDAELSSRPTVAPGVEAEDGSRDRDAFGVA